MGVRVPSSAHFDKLSVKTLEIGEIRCREDEKRRYCVASTLGVRRYEEASTLGVSPFVRTRLSLRLRNGSLEEDG